MHAEEPVALVSNHVQPWPSRISPQLERTMRAYARHDQTGMFELCSEGQTLEAIKLHRRSLVSLGLTPSIPSKGERCNLVKICSILLQAIGNHVRSPTLYYTRWWALEQPMER